ncbi:hypothetical protein QQP08_001004 [Theobroma cacao]|uniref:Uncharacterized protein n=1 Tax=Theobroma cacao TaxID=3641 RepID=A0A061DJE9_THECC|nr:Uncharacterized protein TCM_001426 [Theobroma cacao]WRX08517.1 hypothetical protein QQP08_001004 [Theobroma cacao]
MKQWPFPSILSLPEPSSLWKESLISATQSAFGIPCEISKPFTLELARKRAGEANSKPVVDPLLFDSAEPLTEPVD